MKLSSREIDWEGRLEAEKSRTAIMIEPSNEKGLFVVRCRSLMVTSALIRAYGNPIEDLIEEELDISTGGDETRELQQLFIPRPYGNFIIPRQVNLELFHPDNTFAWKVEGPSTLLELPNGEAPPLRS